MIARLVLSLSLFAAALPLAAQSRPPAGPLASRPAIAAMLADLRAREPRTIADQVAITQIAAPPFAEQARAADYRRRLIAAGIADAAIDPTGNVIGRWRGTGRGPLLVLSAHLDTVFPAGDSVAVTRRDGRYYGRGIADDGRGLTVLLAIAETLSKHRVRTVGDILFVATVGEEGIGNLRGAKALFASRDNIDGFITIEPSLDGINAVANGATGSRRWDITFEGPGGHSFEAFGTPSAIHALGRAVALIADLQPPREPKTTFTVGLVSGGTSVNTIAPRATMTIDIRANTDAALLAMEQQILAAAERGAADEGARWGRAMIRVSRKLVGDRGAGATPPEAPIVTAARDAIVALGQPAPILVTNSTDSNVAISRGIPALMMVGGGRSGGLHAPGEWFDPAESWLGPQSALLTALTLVGVDGVARPTLARRRR